MDKRTRKDTKLRKHEIQLAALAAAEVHGYKLVTRDQIAEQAGCSRALVTKYYGSINAIRDMIMYVAVRENNAEVVLQGLVTEHHIALNAPRELKIAARNRLDIE